MLENVDKTTPRFLIINYLFSELQKRVTIATFNQATVKMF